MGTHEPRQKNHNEVAEGSDDLMHAKTFENDERDCWPAKLEWVSPDHAGAGYRSRKFEQLRHQ